MNQASSAPGSSLLPDTTDLFTAGHLALIAVLAVLVVIGLIWGIRNARTRRVSERELVEHNEALVEEQAAAPSDLPPREHASPRSTAPTELLFEPLPDTPAEPIPAPATASVEVAHEPAALPEAEQLPAAPTPAPMDGPSPADSPVTQLKGLGPKLAARLAENGITTVGHLAALTDDEAAALDARLGPFTGRMGRDRWQEQARFLAAGDTKGFEAVFGRL